jgi:ribosome biogenesis protein MAK21
MQPLVGGDSSGLLVTSGRTGKGHEPLNSESFWKKRSEEVAPEDVFFHNYFGRLGKGKPRTRKPNKKAAAAPAQHGNESEGESEIWQALVESRPELEGESESDDGLDMDDFKSAVEEDDDLKDGDENHVIFSDEGGETEDSELETTERPEDDKTFDMDDSDDDAFRDSDEEVPSDIDQGIEELLPDAGGKGETSRRQKKRKLRHLPTFASVEDYAALLEKDEPEDGF